MSLESYLTQSAENEIDIRKNKSFLEFISKQCQNGIDNEAINIEEFKKDRGEDIIRHDLDRLSEVKIKRLSANTERDNELLEISKIPEWMIHMSTNMFNLFGKNVKSIKTSEFDDWISGIDMVFEASIEKDGLRYFRHSGAAVDVTFSSNPKIAISKKINKIKEKLSDGKLFQVKYFKSEDGSTHHLKGLAKFILNIDIDRLSDLVKHWHRGESDIMVEKLQKIISLEIKIQTDYFITIINNIEDLPEEQRKKMIKAYKDSYTLLLGKEYK